MPIHSIKTTSQHSKYWKDRKIDWNASYLSTWNHPHRELIMYALKSFPWVSLWETGCGPGANLVKIVNTFKDKQLGGSDINPDAIELAKKTFQGGRFNVESTDNMLLSDNSVDVMLSDACLIYFGPLKIKKALHEITRIARNNIVLCEFHETNPFKRWWFRFRTGYNAYNYYDLLEEAGCYDIRMVKITKEFWDGTPWTDYGHVITAKISK